MARVFGLTFSEALSRGTQYRVESLLSREALQQNYLLLSPPRRHVLAQPPQNDAPLVLEPGNRFIAAPVAVLDFQSLYPSVAIAYNLCYSTGMGRASGDARQFCDKTFGATRLKMDRNRLPAPCEVAFLPNGQVFAKHSVREGVLPVLLRRLLAARLGLKRQMGCFRKDEAGFTLLDARQNSLKLICNVVYGYTAAGFSGRMPCVDLAEAIVCVFWLCFCWGKQ